MAKKSQMANGRKRNSLDSVTPTPMTTPRTPTAAAATPLSVLSLKSVWLYDWWLSPAPGKGLAVEGFESRGAERVRVVFSAAIAKRHNATTLETTDGIKISISGFINRSRSLQNGIPLEVCRHFLLGFPYHWEEYANLTPKQRSGLFGLNISGNNINSPLLGSLCDPPASRLHDLLMFAPSDSSNLIKTMVDDLLENSNNCASEHSSPISEHLSGEDKVQISTVSSVDGGNLSNHKNIKVSKTSRSNDGVLDRRSARTDEVQINGQSKIAATVLSPNTGVTTRSMSRLKNLQNEQENNHSAKSPMKHKNISCLNFKEHEETNSENLENKSGVDLLPTSSAGLKNRSCLLTSDTGEDVREVSSRSSVRRVNGAQMLSSNVIENQVEENHKSRLAEYPAKSYIQLSASKAIRSQLGGTTSGSASRGIGGTTLSRENDASERVLVCGLRAMSAERR